MDDSNKGENEPAIPSVSIGYFWLAITLLTWFAIVSVGYALYRPPAPLSDVQAGQDQFSAERAEAILQVLVGDGVPHPAGSEQNKIVRQRIVRLLEGWGYDVVQHETQNTLRNQQDGELIPLVNLMVRLPGTANGPAVMLAAHYDSRVGPGASDDGIGTAALLEIARMLKAQPQSKRRNDLIFLITDGEEMGLLGADKFVEQHPWAQDIGVAINLEARGTSGPSLMFETSDDSQWLIELFARSADRPRASSLFYEIYRFLPNDTDFTIFRRGGMQGYNFAFIGDVKNYHTLQDNFKNADRGSLQHHGQNALSLIRELLEIKLTDTAKGKAVYFDFFGRFIIWWPQSWSLILAVFAVVTLCLSVWFRRISGELAMAPLCGGFLSLLLAMLTMATVVWLIGVAFSLDARFENSWIQSPIPVELTFWLSATTVLVAIVQLVPALQKPQIVFSASLLLFCLFAMASSVLLAGASYLFLVPVLIASLIGLLSCWSKPGSFRFAVYSFATLVALLWLPNEQLFYDAVGFRMKIATAIRVAIVLTAFVPVLSISGSRERAVFGFLTFAAFLISVLAAIFFNPAI